MKKHTFLNSFRFAIDGLISTWKQERNFRIHCWVTIVILALSIWLRLTSLQWCMILFCIGTVLAMELMNSAIEAVVDMVSPEYSELAKIAKDASAAAVLCVTIMSVIIGCIILIPILIETCSSSLVQ